MFFKNKYSLLVFVSSENNLNLPDDEKIELFKVDLNYQKAKEIRQKFYQNKTPIKNFVEEGTFFHEQDIPLFDENGLANVIVSRTPNGKTISTVDSCSCCFSEHDVYDYTISQYEKNLFVENMFLPFLCAQNHANPFSYRQTNKKVFCEVKDFCKSKAKNLPKFLESNFDNNLSSINKHCYDQDFEQILANTLWLKTILAKLDDQELVDARQNFINTMQFYPIKKCSYEEIVNSMVKHKKYYYMTDIACEKYFRRYTKLGKLLNTLTKFDENAPENFDYQKINALTKAIQSNVPPKETLRFLGVKPQNSVVEEKQKEQTFRPRC